MIPKVKTWNFTASTIDGERVTGRVMAPTRLLARLNVRYYKPGLIGIQVGGVTKKTIGDSAIVVFYA